MTVDIVRCMDVEQVLELILIVGVSQLFWSLDYCDHESRVAVEKYRHDTVQDAF